MRMIKATLVKRQSDDGLIEVNDNVELGKTYMVDIDSIQTMKMFNRTYGMAHEKRMIEVASGDGAMPLDLLELEKDA